MSQSTLTTPFSPAPFKPPFWLTNPHLQSILPKFFAPKTPTYRRVVEKDSLDESDIAYDFYDAHPVQAATDGELEQTPLIVLFHGMEGSSDSHYARALAYQMHAQGWHFVVAHFRSCGGIPASGTVFYNAGDTDEVHHALQNLRQQYANIYAVGVSLGAMRWPNTWASMRIRRCVVVRWWSLRQSICPQRRLVCTASWVIAFIRPICSTQLSKSFSQWHYSRWDRLHQIGQPYQRLWWYLYRAASRLPI